MAEEPSAGSKRPREEAEVADPPPAAGPVAAADDEEDEDDYRAAAARARRNAVRPGVECPYMDTISRGVRTRAA